jgi:hypothetical protein
MKFFACGCCLESFPDFHKHEHHKYPRAAGGPDTSNNLLNLCPGCHDALHKVANRLMARAHPEAIKDVIGFIYPDNLQAQKNCFELATLVRDAQIQAREEGLQADHLTQLSTILQKKHKDMLAMRCRDSRVSQESYLRLLVLDDLRRHYPHLIGDPVQESNIIRQLKRRGPRGPSGSDE